MPPACRVHNHVNASLQTKNNLAISARARLAFVPLDKAIMRSQDCKGVTVVLAKGSGGTAVGFVVQEGAWDNDDNYAVFEHMVRLAGPAVGGFPIKLQFMNPKLEVKKEMTVHPYLTEGANDQIGYSG